jgi:hypothetical protein
MHLETKKLKDLSKGKRDNFLIKIGINKNKLESIRKLPAKQKLIESAKLALKIDPTANEDFIEWIAGYEWRGIVHNYFDNLDALLILAKKELPCIKKSFIYKNNNDKIDILRILPSKIDNLNLHYDINGDEIHIWQKDTSRIRSIKLRREVDKKIFLAGISLYAGEGTKAEGAHDVEIVNSNVSLIRTFIRFLSALGIKKEKIKVRVHVHDKEDVEYATQLWMKNAGLIRGQFKKPLIKKKSRNFTKKDFTLDLRFYNSMLHHLLLYWLSDLEKTIDCV